MNDDKILMKTAGDRERVFIRLYQDVFPSVARYVSKKGGTFDEAKDIFQDALMIWYEKAVAGAVVNEKAYLMGIAKHLWLKHYNLHIPNVALDGFDYGMEQDREPSESKILSFLQTAGKRCVDLLRSFYYDEQPLSDIAETFGFSGVRSATVQKYKCLEKVRETVKEKALTYEDFVD